MCWSRFLLPIGCQGLFVMCAGTGSYDCQVTRAYLWWVLKQVPSTVGSPGLIFDVCWNRFLLPTGFICDVCWNRLLRLSGHQSLFVTCVGTGSFYPQVSRAYLWCVLEQASLTRSPGLICDVCWNRFLRLSGHQGLLILWYVLEQVPSTLRSPGLINFVMRVGTGSSDCHQGFFVMCVGTGSYEYDCQVTRDYLWCVLEHVHTDHQGLLVMCIGTGSFFPQVTGAYLWCVLEQVPSVHRSPGLICDVCWNRLLWLSGHQG